MTTLLDRFILLRFRLLLLAGAALLFAGGTFPSGGFVVPPPHHPLAPRSVEILEDPALPGDDIRDDGPEGVLEHWDAILLASRAVARSA
ncbi:MAG: hypothetical protein KTQ49_06435 [Candidatus Omnitrophica bacterium]|nr:hypothetical protein [Candidatus Omnitrophota bacterium]